MSRRSKSVRVSIFLNPEKTEERALLELLKAEPVTAARSNQLKQLAIRGWLLSRAAELGNLASVLEADIGALSKPVGPAVKAEPSEATSAAQRNPPPMQDFLS